MEDNRKCTKRELELIEYLAQKANYELETNWKQSIVAHPITDAAIGPIAIMRIEETHYVEKRSHLISDCMFRDADGVYVTAYLLVDSEQNLCELDLWKGDYSEIMEIPSMENMEDILLME